MALETGTYISDLVPTNPAASDPVAFADDHMRLIKSVVKNSFPNVSGPVTKTHTQLNNAVDKTGDTMTGPLTLSGVPTSSLQAATKGYVDSSVGALASAAAAYPVGSIYMNASNSTNPASLLGFGSWVSFGSGRVLVGVDTGDGLFNTPEKTGGTKDATLVNHSHAATVTDPGHTHGGGYLRSDLGGSVGPAAGSTIYGANIPSNTTGISVGISTVGSSATNANVQPYITVYMWKRTA